MPFAFAVDDAFPCARARELVRIARSQKWALPFHTASTHSDGVVVFGQPLKAAATRLRRPNDWLRFFQPVKQ